MTKNIFTFDTSLSLVENKNKNRSNNLVIKSAEFVQSLKNPVFYINTAYKIAYQTKNCGLVLLLDKMLNKSKNKTIAE